MRMMQLELNDVRNGSSSEQDEDNETVSTPTVPQISTGVLHLGGAPSTIQIENSSDIHIGSRLNYNAPVTINQCVHIVKNSDVIQDDVILREAIRGPMHLENAPENTLSSQDTLTNLHVKVQATSSPCDGPRQLPSIGNWLCACCRHRFICLSVVVLLVIFVIAMVAFLPYGDGSSKPRDSSQPPPTDPIPVPNITLPGGHRIYSREDWGAQPPRYERPLRHPTPFILISHTASDACFSLTTCARLMRQFQDMHISSNMPDIGYSFAVGGDGNVYEGRGWDATNMHTGFVKRCNIGISFIGNFLHDTPTSGQIAGVEELIRRGLELRKVAEDYKVVSMNETYNTLSPGVTVYNVISQWSHFFRPSRDDIGMCPYIV